MSAMPETADRTLKARFNVAGVLAVASGHLLHDTYSAFLFPLLPLLIDKFALSLTMAGTLTLFVRLPSLLQPFIGYLADRVNLRYFLIIAPLLTAIMMSLIGLAPSIGILIIMVTVVGISAASFHAPAPAAISVFSGSRLGFGLSIYQMGGELGRTIGPLIIVAAVSWWSLEGTYRLILPGVIGSAGLFWQLRGVTLGERPAATQAAFGATFARMRPLLVPLACVVLTRSLMSTSLITYLPVYLDEKGASLWLVGGALTILEGAGVAGVLVGGGLSDRVGRRQIILFAQVAAPLLLLLFLAVEGWQMFPVLVALGLVTFSATPVLIALVLESYSDTRATANGIFSAITFALSAFSTVLVGYIGDHLGLHAAFTIGAIAALTGVPFIFMLPKR